MLNKGLRDQESIRIDAILKSLLAIIFVPDLLSEEDKNNIEDSLKDFGLSIQSLNDLAPQDLIFLLDRLHLDWNQLEQFADFLVSFSKVEKFNFLNKACAIYNYIQKESKTFSFGINTKLSLFKPNL